MTTQSVGTEQDDEGTLQFLQQVQAGEGETVHYYVCSRCMELVEKSGESAPPHECILPLRSDSD